MLREAADVWWPRIHREIVEKAKSCQQCCQSGKNIKSLQSQNEFGKLAKPEVPNEKISLDFAGPFQIPKCYKQKEQHTTRNFRR